ncbi:MAG: tRNA guanosine(34) transglycosylase Tgt [Candidatus Moranbacteria bacterium]|nr:tRNA guanosine(34) transglycosylase Tgt [Candidatus Moranbacteria bacterium]
MLSIDHIVGKARSGMLRTRAGEIPVPFFMPDATRAAVRGVTPEEIRNAGTPALVVNTYHLMLAPGEGLIAQAGGIRPFMGWSGPVLSDSGGYQVYSLIHRNPEMGKITEDGAEFRSVLDGSKRLLTPERAIAIQFDLGVDMMVVLDDPRPNDAPRGEIAEAVERSIRWARRCRDEFERQVAARGLTEETRPLLFGVVQGGPFPELRTRCAEGLVEIGFDGYGFGGRHVDSEGNFLADIVSHTASVIPEERVRFALGVGTPEDIVRFHHVGWDMFDCVIPTREGRHGRLFRWNGVIPRLETVKTGHAPSLPEESSYETININNSRFAEDFAPIDPGCDCPLCTNHSAAYLHHLFRVSDPLGGRLASIHNLRFYARLMETLREEGR